MAKGSPGQNAGPSTKGYRFGFGQSFTLRDLGAMTARSTRSRPSVPLSEALVLPAQGTPTCSGDKFWSSSARGTGSRWHDHRRQLEHLKEGFGEASEFGLASTGSSLLLAERPNPAQLMQWVDHELQIMGKHGPVTQADRVRVFSEALGLLSELLPECRPLMLGTLREFELLIHNLQEEISNMAVMEGKLKALKAESLSMVSESTARYQVQVSSMQKRMAALEQERLAHAEDKAALEDTINKLTERADKDRYQAAESHVQNLDIIKYLERQEKTLENMRKQERDHNFEERRLQGLLKKADDRIGTLEQQLKWEQEKSSHMVVREEHEKLGEELRIARQKQRELEEQNAATHKDYMSIVDQYNKAFGQGSTDKARPLTPRPIWTTCRGLLDPGIKRSAQKADALQETSQQMLCSTRTLMAVYGCSIASQKSAIFQSIAKYAAPIAPATTISESRASSKNSKAPIEENADVPEPEITPDFLTQKAAAAFWTGQEEAVLLPDTNPNTPEVLRHEASVKNMHLSRKKILDFMESIIQLRMRSQSFLSRPFLDFMLEHIPQEHREESTEFAINVFAAIRLYSAEPDFLAFYLLIIGKISDVVVKDNRQFSSVLTGIFEKSFPTSDVLTRQKLVGGLKEVLQHKKIEQLSEIMLYLPYGTQETLINWKWLFHEDLYVCSPITYALRLQHLEEALGLSVRIEQAVNKCPLDSANTIRLGDLQEAISEDETLKELEFDERDFAKAFVLAQKAKLDENVRGDATVVQLMLKQSDIFTFLFSPNAEPGDEGDEDSYDGEGEA